MEFWHSSLRTTGLIRSSGTMLDFWVWNCSLHQLPHGPSSSTCCRRKSWGWMVGTPGCLQLMELYSREFSLSHPLLPLPGDTQPISNCNFLLLAKKIFSTCLIYFSSTSHLSQSCQAGGLLGLRIKLWVICLFSKVVNFMWLLSDTQNVVWKNTIFLPFFCPAPRQCGS